MNNHTYEKVCVVYYNGVLTVLDPLTLVLTNSPSILLS